MREADCVLLRILRLCVSGRSPSKRTPRLFASWTIAAVIAVRRRCWRSRAGAITLRLARGVCRVWLCVGVRGRAVLDFYHDFGTF